MSPATATRSASTRRAASRRAPRRTVRRGRLAALLLALLAAIAGVSILADVGPFHKAVEELTLPLRYDDIIRQQAREKNLDPALVAAVIYEESKFRDQTSPAGAKGLMQILPDTARFIAQRSGGTRFEIRDLATPQVNIAYGSFYLRYLLDRYGGNEMLAVAAYNAGETNVSAWVREAGGVEGFQPERDIPFTETREYVKGVLIHREEYRERYPEELGL